MTTIDDLARDQADQAAALEELAGAMRDLYGRFGAQRRKALEDRLQERFPSSRDHLSTDRPNVGSTIVGNAQPYDLFPGLSSAWVFEYNDDGTIDSAWRSGDEGAASVIVKWSSGQVILVSVSRGGRKSETHLEWSGSTLLGLTRSFAIVADQTPDEYLCYFGLVETPMVGGSYSESPTADYLAYLFI